MSNEEFEPVKNHEQYLISKFGKIIGKDASRRKPNNIMQSYLAIDHIVQFELKCYYVL